MPQSRPRAGFYPGSFDPTTNGHVDVLAQALRLVDRLVIAIGVHPSKSPLFPVEERAEMIKEVGRPIAQTVGAEIEVTTYGDLAVTAARRAGAELMIRGVRDGTDLDYEMQLAGMNGVLDPGVRTVFLPASPSVRPITATLVRQIASMGGDVTPFVPPIVAERLRLKFPRR